MATNLFLKSDSFSILGPELEGESYTHVSEQNTVPSLVGPISQW